jgi:hypothetical protein
MKQQQTPDLKRFYKNAQGSKKIIKIKIKNNKKNLILANQTKTD